MGTTNQFLGKIFWLTPLALVSCGGEEPDFWIGPTAVKYVHLAEPYYDLNRGLWDSRICLARFGYDPDEVLDFWLEIHGPGSKIDYDPDRLGYGRLPDGFHIWGYYDVAENTIQLLQVGPPPYSIFNEYSVFIHELIAHRLPFVALGHANDRHAFAWQEETAPLEECIRTNRCTGNNYPWVGCDSGM